MLRSDLGSKVSDVYGGSDLYNSLAALGIRSKNDGTLELNSGDFREAVSADLDGITELFAGDEGVMKALESAVDLRTDRYDGLIKARKDGIEATMKLLDSNIERAESRLVRVEEDLNRRFSSFEVLMAQLQSQGSTLLAFGF